MIESWQCSVLNSDKNQFVTKYINKVKIKFYINDRLVAEYFVTETSVTILSLNLIKMLIEKLVTDSLRNNSDGTKSVTNLTLQQQKKNLAANIPNKNMMN